MTSISAIAPISLNDQKSIYNAVKIRVNSPQANLPSSFVSPDGNAEYNAVNIEVNEPELNVVKKPVYFYPLADDIVTYEQAGFLPLNVPEIPVMPSAYPANFVSYEADVKEKQPEAEKSDSSVDVVTVPEPNFTTVEDEKKLMLSKEGNEVTFNGLSFKALPDANVAENNSIKPAVNIENVVASLKSSDFDKQALQLDEIANLVIDKSKRPEALPYLTSEVFAAIGNIITKDSSSLDQPEEVQIEARKKIIMNEILKEKMLSENPDMKPEDVQTGIEITENDIALAMKLSPFEMAERNKEYGIYTLAGLINIYTEEFEKNIGNKVPFTDIPCISSIVNTLKSSENPDLKIAAINSLMVIEKPEYKQEISSILRIAAKDKNPEIAQYAMSAVKALDKAD